MLQRLSEKVSDPTSALRDLCEYQLGVIDEGFRNEVDPDGVPWVPNTPYTIAEKQRLGRINKILQSTGTMRSGYNYRIEGSTGIVGNRDPKVVKHQLGLEGLPVRKTMGIRNKDLPVYEEILLAYIDE